MLTINKDSEAKILEHLSALQDNSSGYYALHFHLSKLQVVNRSEFQIKIALNIMTDFFKQYEGTIFLCKDYDIFVIYKGNDRQLLEKAIFQLRYLFIDDPLAFIKENIENHRFCTVYVLAFQWRDFYIACRKKILNVPSQEEYNENVQSEKKEIGLAALVALEKELESTDLSHTIRSQPVCASVENVGLKPIFNEVYISMSHLRHAVKFEPDLVSNKILFRYFTNILDKHLLNNIRTRLLVYPEGPISINLNINTILSDSFKEFDSLIKTLNKSAIVIEIDVTDVFSDIQSFIEARDYLKSLGYRICLDGLNNVSFVNIDRESLGVDLVKLQWNLELDTSLDDKQYQKLIEAVKNCGPNRIILCHCDSRYAIDYGKALGLSLFQGWYLDKLIKQTQPEATKEAHIKETVNSY
jgi:EAL domain-containing protein (putative c-di-GMP-specific phosphodiesterase class I)